MAIRFLKLPCAFLLISLYSAAIVQSASFPSLDDIEIEYYTTEVQITEVYQEISAYATEYYDNIDDKGALKIYLQGDVRSIYYDNSTFQITEVNEPNCTSTDEDISDYDYFPFYYGWLNKDPLIIGPSAPLWYAQTRGDHIKSAEPEVVRNIKCDKFVLPILNKKDNLTIEYFFAPEDWDTPYKFETKTLRVPIRIRISGASSRYASQMTPVDQITDFAYFKPSVQDFNDLLPPLAVGCKSKKETDDMPKIPQTFQYSAEVVDLIQADKHYEFEVQYQGTWFDYEGKMARLDRYSRKDGYKSTLYDFNTGTMYKIQNDGSCRMDTLRDAEFETYDYGFTSRMMEPKEALNLDGTFYEMGKRDFRGLECDVYESVKFDEWFEGKKYYKLVVTAYFTTSSTEVGVKGVMESRIPVYFLITGWDTKSKIFQRQYNVFEFYTLIWPEMYSSFKLENCYVKSESKAYFVLILEVPPKIAAIMEDQDELVIKELRSMVGRYAKVPEMRIPYLKADYKSTGVFVTGVVLERPPAFLQFFKFDTGPTITYDPMLKMVDSKTAEECSNACIDEPDFLCKGFYMCNKACFLKSTDPVDQEDGGKSWDLGECTEYLRAEIDSTNFRQAYLEDALENLETAILDKNVSVEFLMPNEAVAVVTVKDIVVGDGPYTGADAGDKPYSLSVELRKLDSSLETTKTMEYAETVHDCYKRCKEAGSMCSSFSFCPDSQGNKECMITSVLVVRGIIKDTDLIPDKNCNIYNLKFSDYYTAYPERISLLPGDKVIRSMDSLEKCAMNCRLEKEFECRGFEYCRSAKTCTLHKKHILDLKPGETGTPSSRRCTHYAARYIADYQDLGGVLIDDKSNVRYDTSLDDCAKICSVELKENCKSFNFCPGEDFSQSTCALSSKLLRDDGITTTENWKCNHYEKRDTVHDWDNTKSLSLAGSGYTKKGFAGLVIGMLALGLIVGALAFVVYSVVKSRSSNEGMAVRFMRNES